MRKITFLVIPMLGLLFAVQSCKPRTQFNDDPQDINTLPIEEIKAPDNFNYETHKDLYVRVAVKNPISSSTRYLINIYTNVPGTQELVKSGLTNAADFEYATTIRVPAAQEFLWIERVNPDGTSEFHRVNANTFVSNVFDSKPENVYTFTKDGSGMDCNSSCDNSYNNHSGNLNLSGNTTTCITGSFNGSITVGNNATVKICATSGTITSLTLNHSNSRVYILEDAQIKINNLNINNKNAEVKSWSDSVVMTGSLSQGGKIRNYGKFYVNGSMNINSNGDFKNYGWLNVGGSMNINDDMDNYHFMSVGGSLAVNSSSDFNTYCNLYVGGDLASNNEIKAYGLVKVVGQVTINSNGEIKLYDRALLTCDDMTLNDYIEGNGTGTSIVKVADRTVLNSNGQIKGTLNFCDSTGIETNNGDVKNPAQLSCTGTIPTSTCNPEGFNVVTVQDDDNDGVANEQDAYPNDASRAFNSYYPTASTFTNIAFEDLWPNTGDFDFNDMVIAYNMQKVLNADEEVVDVIFKVNVRAVGGSFDNGFGIQLNDINPSAVSTVTGHELSKSIVTLSANKTEANQDKAVIICFDSPEPTLQRATGSFFNTIQANGRGTSDTLSIKVSFSTPQAESALEPDKINPFIFTNGRRGYEVHLGNFAPTSLANTSLFGTGQDDSDPQNGRYYKTDNNLPWAISITETFSYPEEKAPVNVAYKFFNQWAISGGTQKTDWYRDEANYRETGRIFSLLQ